MTEKALQATVVKFAQQRGWLVYHTYDSRRSAPGFPDLCLVRGPSLMFVELKSEKGRLKKEQGEWRDALELAGQAWHLWRPADLDEAFSILG